MSLQINGYYGDSPSVPSILVCGSWWHASLHRFLPFWFVAPGGMQIFCLLGGRDFTGGVIFCCFGNIVRGVEVGWKLGNS
jgi:hypothetical protein